MSDEEAPPPAASDSEEDLFADDEDAPAARAASPAGGSGADDDDDDNLFDSDDDVGAKQAVNFDDDDDLFADSDDDDDDGGADGGEEAAGGRRRLAKGRKRGRSLERFDKTALEKAKRARTGPRAKGVGAQEEDYKEDRGAYESEEDTEANADDRAFIDGDDDNADVLGEYANDNEQWDDAPGLGGYTTLKQGKIRGGVPSSAAMKQSDLERMEEGPVKEVFAKKKKRQPHEMSAEEKDQFVQGFLRDMSEAHEKDEKIRKDPDCREPAVHKLQMLPSVIATLQRRRLHMILLDYDLLREMAKWIKPLEKDTRRLPNETIRTELIQRLHDLPIELDHLKRSGIGKEVMALYKHPKESTANRRSLKVLIERWARPIYSKSSTIHAARAETVDSVAPPPQVAPQMDDGGRVNLGQTLKRQRVRNAEESSRPRLEFHLGFDYARQPAPRMDRVQQMPQAAHFTTLQKKIDAKGRRKRR